MKRKHPIQPLRIDPNGIVRFTSNSIVEFLLDQYKPGLNDLLFRFGENADYEQLMMLIGYSVSGFGDLDIDRRTIAVADRMSDALLAKSNDT